MSISGLQKCFEFSALTFQTLLYPFQFLHDKDPFLRDGHAHVYKNISDYPLLPLIVSQSPFTASQYAIN